MRDQRGLSGAVEAAIILPVLAMFIGLVVVVARDALAGQAVASAAAHGARAASVERSASAAVPAAESVVQNSLDEAGVDCITASTAVDAAGLTAPIGARASVSVTVTCQVDFGVTFPGFPSSRSITETRTSPVDTYRSR